MKNYILVIDEGTTGVRALLFDRNFIIVNQAYEKLEVLYPGPEQVELDAESVYDKAVNVCREVVKKQGISPEEIECVGMTSQRASWLFWDKTTGKPLRNVVTWMDGRGMYSKQKLIEDPVFNEKFPGLAPNLPGSWMPLCFEKAKDDEPEFAEALKGENVIFGHIDSYLGWRLTKGAVHATTKSAASASGVYLSQYDMWNGQALEYFGLNPATFPEVLEESADFGMLDKDILGMEIPIYSSFADQQAALFSQNCLEENMVKCTLGTGAFVDMNTAKNFKGGAGLVSAISWQINGEKNYLLEGMSYTAGACLEWAKNQFKLFDDFGDMEKMVAQVENSAGVYFVPAISGLWGDNSAKGAYMGIRPNITNNHIMLATLEGIAFGTASLLEQALSGGVAGGFENQIEGTGIKEIKISGGASKSDTIAQTLANVTGAKVVRPKSVEATALGAAEAAAIKAGWITMDDIGKYLDIDKEYILDDCRQAQIQTYQNWKKVVERTLKWDV